MSKIHFHKDYETPMDRNVGLGSWGSDITGGGANQLGMMNKVISSGQGYVEASALQKQQLDKIPKQHWDEMNRLARLTGTKVSLHGPMMDLIGMTPTGISEEKRQEEVTKVMDVLERGYQLGRRDEHEGKWVNTPVNFHASAIAGGGGQGQGITEVYKKDLQKKSVQPGVTDEEKLISHAIDTETGQLQPLLYKIKRYAPTTEEEKKKGYHEAKFTPDESIKALNRDTWDKEVRTVLTYEDKVFEIEKNIDQLKNQILHLEYGAEKGVLRPDEEAQLARQSNQIKLMEGHITQLAEDMHLGLQGMHDTLHKYYTSDYIEKGKEKQFYKEVLNHVADASISSDKINNDLRDQIDKLEKEKREYRSLINQARNDEEKSRLIRKQEEIENRQLEISKKHLEVLKQESRNVARVMGELRAMPPKRFVPLEDYSVDKGSQTFAEAAVKAYEKWGEKAPLIVIENPPVGQFGIATGEKLRDMVKKTRDRFVDQVKGKIGLEEARKVSEKLIGATWDVGHINLLKSMGYTDEDIAEETKKIAPLVKHWHITDNFGETDDHLVPGMGNVPFDKITKYFDNNKEAFKILEAGQYVADFKQSPFPDLMEYFDSPIYSMTKEPYWRGNFEVPNLYSTGYGEIFPQQHFDMYGAGFATLPRELGGQVSGNKSRFSETPNE